MGRNPAHARRRAPLGGGELPVAALIASDCGAPDLWTAFGPTNIAIHKVNTAIELGDVQTVLDHGMTPGTSALPAEHRVRYLLDVARTHSLTGKSDDALEALLKAERLAPEQARTHYLGRRVITTLMTNSKGKPPVQLGKLAARAGLQAV